MADPGNTLNTSLFIGNLSSLRTYKDFVGTFDRDDFYRFNLTQTSNFSLQLSGLTDYADVKLIADVNNNGLVDYDETLDSDYGYSNGSASLSSTLAAGTYFVQVYTDYQSYNSNYTLNLSAAAALPTTPSNPGNTLNTSLNLGNLSSLRTYKDFVGTFDRDDFYRFNLTQTSNFSLQLSGLADSTNVKLIADVNNNGLVDYSETLDIDYGYSNGSASISSTLAAGTYFVQVYTGYQSYNSNYTLSLSATVNTPSNYDDYIIGTYNNETINGLAGNDRIEGGSGNDYLLGSIGNDVLLGQGDSDRLDGGVGNDYLVGDYGNDLLYGNIGSDRMIGGVGHDFYYVDNTSDIVSETSTLAIEIDTVVTSVNYALGANLERVYLGGTATINGTGNSLNNYIVGNTANNILNGSTGIDTLVGGAGNDILVGGLGNDCLTGSVGADRIAFYTRNEGIDRITDFIATDDAISVSASGFGGGLIANTYLAASQFVLGTSALDANDRFIYNKSTGALFFDLDGTGASAKIQIATFNAGTAFTQADILITV